MSKKICVCVCILSRMTFFRREIRYHNEELLQNYIEGTSMTGLGRILLYSGGPLVMAEVPATCVSRFIILDLLFGMTAHRVETLVGDRGGVV